MSLVVYYLQKSDIILKKLNLHIFIVLKTFKNTDFGQLQTFCVPERIIAAAKKNGVKMKIGYI